MHGEGSQRMLMSAHKLDAQPLTALTHSKPPPTNLPVYRRSVPVLDFS